MHEERKKKDSREKQRTRDKRIKKDAGRLRKWKWKRQRESKRSHLCSLAFFETDKQSPGCSALYILPLNGQKFLGGKKPWNQGQRSSYFSKKKKCFPAIFCFCLFQD